jgi:hypothetical protein
VVRVIVCSVVNKNIRFSSQALRLLIRYLGFVASRIAASATGSRILLLGSQRERHLNDIMKNLSPDFCKNEVVDRRKNLHTLKHKELAFYISVRGIRR